MGLAVQNTSSGDFTMNSMTGNLYANDYFIGNVSSFTPVTIKANGETIVNLSVRMSLLGIVNDIINAFQNNSTTQELELSGTINVDNFQVPLNIKYKVGL